MRANSQKGDRRADSYIEPVVRFLVQRLGDPVMLDFNGDHLLKIKKALPAIPTPRRFAQSERSRYFRWQGAAENGWTREKNGKVIQLKRVSETTLIGRYESGLNIRSFQWSAANHCDGCVTTEAKNVTTSRKSVMN
jgi:hypothetical protein